MKKETLLILLSIFVVGSALAFVLSPVQSAPPPTPAYFNYTVIDDIAWPNDTTTSIQAITYKDIVYLASDGSIEFNFTTYP